MKKISSGGTFFIKRVFPCFWFGFLVIFELVFLFSSAPKTGENLMFVFVPVLMAFMGVHVMKKMVWNLADEVYDAGDHLIIKKGGIKEEVGFSEIKNISYVEMANPPRVTINVRRKTALGEEISFSPPRTGFGFQKKLEILNLIDRVDQARGF